MENKPLGIIIIKLTNMRRANQEITKRSEIDKIINKAMVCRLATCRNNIPYIIPLSFGYDGTHLYLHTAIEGKKIDFWETNALVCIEFDIDVSIKQNTKACKWSAAYQSVVGYGKISELLTNEDKIYALKQIMQQYSHDNWEFIGNELKNIRLWKIWILELTGKKS